MSSNHRGVLPTTPYVEGASDLRALVRLLAQQAAHDQLAAAAATPQSGRQRSQPAQDANLNRQSRVRKAGTMTTKETPPIDRPWLTPGDVARQLRISVKTVQRELDCGHLVGHRIGSQWRISPENLTAYLPARRGGGRG
jgi:excisionase family DNA binding protein